MHQYRLVELCVKHKNNIGGSHAGWFSFGKFHMDLVEFWYSLYRSNEISVGPTRCLDEILVVLRRMG